MKKSGYVWLFCLLTIWSYASIGNSLYSFDSSEPSGPIHIVYVLSQLIIEAVAIINVISGNFLNKTGRLMLIWVIYALCVEILYPGEIITDMRTILWWPSVYYLFYIITRTGGYKPVETFVKTFFPIILIGNSLIFIVIKILLTIYYGLFSASNDIYYVVLLFPLLVLIKNKYLRYIFFALCFLLALYSFKRGAQLCVLMALVIYLITELRSVKRNIFRTIFLICIIVGGAWTAFNYVNNSTEGHVMERISEMEESGGSGRESIYQEVIKEYSSKPFYEQIIGVGMNGVRTKYHITNNKDGRNYSAHNDFLEMLVDYGVIGLLLYILIIISFISEMMYSRGRGLLSMFQLSLISLSSFIIMSLISHLFLYPTFIAYLMIAFGIAAGMNKYTKASLR